MMKDALLDNPLKNLNDVRRGDVDSAEEDSVFRNFDAVLGEMLGCVGLIRHGRERNALGFPELPPRPAVECCVAGVVDGRIGLAADDDELSAKLLVRPIAFNGASTVVEMTD